MMAIALANAVFRAARESTNHLMRDRISRVGVLICATAALSLTMACASPTRPTPQSACPPGSASRGSMTALIDGVAWSARCVPSQYTNYREPWLEVLGLDEPLESGRALVLHLQIARPFIGGTPVVPQPLVPGE